MADSATALQDWLLLMAEDGSPATLPANLTRAFQASDPAVLPVFVAHAWEQHLRAEADRGRQEACEVQRQHCEAAFHAELGLDAQADADLALQLGRAVDRGLSACRCELLLTAQLMPDGQRRFRLELGDSSAGTGRSQETVQVLSVAGESLALAIRAAIHAVLDSRGCQVSATPGLFHLEAPQLVSLVAILKRLAVPESKALMDLMALAA
ncbi:hypothetical protein VB738_14205 [Cyanobium gracile UHCC 0139]|uniref:Uncharacterized protein n=1 Tax=Cyanobium gracile UHCC 0139 TaxID=3110308 RepID=A0ABU5RX98_9CYAN|nr:hypothetical protein [Cyanobium gracile]MEA5392412.1 hypothetical protein [Cyanobium gracile UHCC 0139]